MRDVLGELRQAGDVVEETVLSISVADIETRVRHHRRAPLAVGALVCAAAVVVAFAVWPRHAVTPSRVRVVTSPTVTTAPAVRAAPSNLTISGRRVPANVALANLRGDALYPASRGAVWLDQGDSVFEYSAPLGWSTLVMPGSSPPTVAGFAADAGRVAIALYDGTTIVVNESTDGGTTWSARALPGSYTDGAEVNIQLLEGGDTLAVVNHGAYDARTTDVYRRHAERWVLVARDPQIGPDPLTLDGVHVFDEHPGGVIRFSTDGFKTWRTAAPPTSTHPIIFDSASARLFDSTTFAIGAHECTPTCVGLVLVGHVDAGGITWQKQLLLPTESNFAATSYSTANTTELIAAGNDAIFTVHDSGSTWQEKTVPFANGRVETTSDNALWLYFDGNTCAKALASCVGTPRLAVSTDGGATWNPVALPIAPPPTTTTATACRIADLALEFFGGGRGEGSDFGTIVIRDVGARPCRLPGPVVVTGVDAMGRAVTQTVSYPVASSVVLTARAAPLPNMQPPPSNEVVADLFMSAEYRDDPSMANGLCSINSITPATWMLTLAGGTATVANVSHDTNPDDLAGLVTCKGEINTPGRINSSAVNFPSG